jgi:hypothetical protein
MALLDRLRDATKPTNTIEAVQQPEARTAPGTAPWAVGSGRTR